jgi:rare lipoprotein A
MIQITRNKYSLLNLSCRPKSLYLLVAIAFISLKAEAQWPAADSIKSTLYVKEGVASYYANRFHGRKTTNGERYKRNLLTAAHRTLPFGTLVKVTSLRNKKWVIVRIKNCPSPRRLKI